MKKHGLRRATAAALGATALVSPFSAAAQEPSWRAVSSFGDQSAFIDTASIRRDRDKVRFWHEIRWSKPDKMPDGALYDRLGSLVEIDCRAKTARNLKLYAKLGERQLFEAPLDNAPAPVSPDTNRALEMRAACQNEWPR